MYHLNDAQNPVDSPLGNGEQTFKALASYYQGNLSGDERATPLACHPVRACRHECRHPASRGGLPRRISECSRLMRGTSLHRIENLDRETLWEPSPQSAT
jgi:hypothetical protein